jgi:hypothetical protein
MLWGLPWLLAGGAACFGLVLWWEWDERSRERQREERTVFNYAEYPLTFGAPVVTELTDDYFDFADQAEDREWVENGLEWLEVFASGDTTA